MIKSSLTGLTSGRFDSLEVKQADGTFAGVVDLISSVGGGTGANLTALTTRVTDLETIQNGILAAQATKASTSSVTALSTTVTAVQADVTQHGTDIGTLHARALHGHSHH